MKKPIPGLKISHPDKVLFPEAGITKMELAQYFYRVTDQILPHIKNRPLTLKRFIRGITEEGFYSKHAPAYFPDFIETIDVPLRGQVGRSIKMVTIDETKDLIYLAGQDVIELHMGLSISDSLEKPDQIIFDLDPSDDDFEKIRKSAFALRDLLDESNINSFVKTTGSRGVHIHIPLEVEYNFDDVKLVAKNIAKRLNKRFPNLTTLEHRKKNRGSKVFIDYLRNDYGMTAIAPYSLRGLKGAPISTPITWIELKKPALGPQSYSLSNIFKRLGQIEDPWKQYSGHRVRLKSLIDYLEI